MMAGRESPTLPIGRARATHRVLFRQIKTDEFEVYLSKNNEVFDSFYIYICDDMQRYTPLMRYLHCVQVELTVNAIICHIAYHILS